MEAPNWAQKFDSFLDQAEDNEDKAEWQSCLKDLQEALNICDTRPIPDKEQRRQQVLMKMGGLYRRFGRYDEAVVYLNGALDADSHVTALKRAAILGELGVLYRHKNDFFRAREVFSEQYLLAKETALVAEAEMCRAVGNEGMSAYNEHQQRRKCLTSEDLRVRDMCGHDEESLVRIDEEPRAKLLQDNSLLAYATSQIEERIARAQALQDRLAGGDTDEKLRRRYAQAARRWETIGLDRLSLCLIAAHNFDEAVKRTQEAMTKQKGMDPTVTALSRFFHGNALWCAGQQQAAEGVWNSTTGVCSPAMGLCKEPSSEHADYLELLADAGIDFDVYDEQGFSALDYAVLSRNQTATAANKDAERMIDIIDRSLRKTLAADHERQMPQSTPQDAIQAVEAEVRQRHRQANVRRYYRNLLQEHLRPQLKNSLQYSHDCVRMLRQQYASYLDADIGRRQVFDWLYYVPYDDFRTLGHMPQPAERSVDSSRRLATRMDTSRAGGTSSADEDIFLVFFSYRWIGHNMPDDGANTQYSRMLNAVEALISQRGLTAEHVGLWLDIACIDQEDVESRERGIDSLPMAVLQCDVMISLEDDEYYNRAWCAVEVRLMQELIGAYHKHERWSHRLLSGESTADGLLERSQEHSEVPITSLAVTVKGDLPKIDFLMRQSKLLGCSYIFREQHIMDLDHKEISYVVAGVATAANISEAGQDMILKWMLDTNQKLFSPHPPTHQVPVESPTLREWCAALAADQALLSLSTRCAIGLVLAICFLRTKSRGTLPATPAELSQTWELCYHALVTSEQTADFLLNPTRSAQGFLATPLCSVNINGRIDFLFRFHVWLPDSQRGVTGWQLHSHQAAARSWVLAGSAVDNSYEVVESAREQATHSEHVPLWASAEQKELTRSYQTHRTSSKAVGTGIYVKASLRSTARYGRDASYVIPAGSYHLTEVPHDGFYATLFSFDAQQGYIADAGILGPVDGKDSVQNRYSGGSKACDLARLVETARGQEPEMLDDIY
ncbi:unnamed protein product [Zymoseptoria tritici ST99CH_1E4]|uniref:Uncharacterized protein n=1 Tax=Zymoseptoria tritici ST99CH_1E4 TaxID=1276532 RepID=A0A2H1GU25_ZYMTR|nr:unnamed protein product [Zymoseptoria tritici ST99CH_1E4]